MIATRVTTGGSLRRLGVALLLAAFVLVLLLAVPSLRGVLRAMSHMGAAWVTGGVALEIASCTAFVLVFRSFFDAVPARQARRLAWTEMGSGALLPGGGVGGLAVGGWLMHLTGMSTRRVIERSSALYFVTTAVNVAAVIVAGALLATGLASGPGGFVRAILPVLVALFAAAVVLAMPRVRSRRGTPSIASTVGGDLVDGITDASEALRRPSWRLWGALGYLGFDIAVLWCTFRGLGIAARPAPLVLAYNIGYLADLLPVPGGVGVLDAGLVGTLVVYGFPATNTAAAVLVYHAIAFWIPGLGGLIALALLRRRLPTGVPSPAASEAG